MRTVLSFTNRLTNGEFFDDDLTKRARRHTKAARESLEKSIELRRRSLRDNHPAVAEALSAVAETHRTENNLQLAGPLAQLVLEIRIAAFGPSHPLVAESMNNLGMVYFALGKYSSSRVLYDKALLMRQKLLGPYHPAVAQTINNLASLLHLSGNVTDAEKLYRRAVLIKQVIHSVHALSSSFCSSHLCSLICSPHRISRHIFTLLLLSTCFAKVG